MHYDFYQNTACEYYPCHAGVDPEQFNCLFCYCPLYALGRDCGGNFSYLKKNSVKDCSSCTLPHLRKNYPVIVERTALLVQRVAAAEKTQQEHERG